MGGVLARNLLRAGEKVTVFSRSAGRAEALAAEGAAIAQERGGLAACDVLCTCLPLSQHVRDAVLGEAGLYAKLKPGSVHIEFSTIDPAAAEELAEAAHTRGLAYLQSTVGKTPQMAERCEEPLFLGADGEDDRKALAGLMPVLEKIGRPRDVGTVKAACAVKLLSNLIGMANLVVLAEGMRLGALAGMEPHELLELLQDTGARSFQMDVRGPWMADGDYAPRFGVELAAKDLRLGCAMARSWGYAPKMIEQAYACFTEAGESGLGLEDACAVYKVMK